MISSGTACLNFYKFKKKLNKKFLIKKISRLACGGWTDEEVIREEMTLEKVDYDDDHYLQKVWVWYLFLELEFLECLLLLISNKKKSKKG